MKSFSIDFLSEANDPCFNDMKVGRVDSIIFLLIIKEFDADFSGKNIVLNIKRVT